MIKYIGFDGDDTLWHNMPVFTLTEEWFKDLLAPYAPHVTAKDRLTETEMRNLQVFGYGAKGFTLSMIETAIEVTDGKIATSDIREIIEAGKRMIGHPVQVLECVRETLETLSREFQLILITKGDLFDQESKIARSELAELFWRVEIVSEKDTSTYRRILKANSMDPDDFIMVGNSLKSDVIPPLELGSYAAHIPYHTTWIHEEVGYDVPHHDRLVRLDDIRQIPPHVRKLNSPL